MAKPSNKMSVMAAATMAAAATNPARVFVAPKHFVPLDAPEGDKVLPWEEIAVKDGKFKFIRDQKIENFLNSLEVEYDLVRDMPLNRIKRIKAGANDARLGEQMNMEHVEALTMAAMSPGGLTTGPMVGRWEGELFHNVDWTHRLYVANKFGLNRCWAYQIKNCGTDKFKMIMGKLNSLNGLGQTPEQRMTHAVNNWLSQDEKARMGIEEYIRIEEVNPSTFKAKVEAKINRDKAWHDARYKVAGVTDMVPPDVHLKHIFSNELKKYEKHEIYAPMIKFLITTMINNPRLTGEQCSQIVNEVAALPVKTINGSRGTVPATVNALVASMLASAQGRKSARKGSKKSAKLVSPREVVVAAARGFAAKITAYLGANDPLDIFPTKEARKAGVEGFEEVIKLLTPVVATLKKAGI